MAGNLAKAIILNSGRTLMTAALAGYSRFTPHSFRLGSSFAFEQNVTDSNVRGVPIWNSPASLIQARIIAADTVRYTLTIPEGVGPFTFGNLVLFATNFDGTPVPFVSVVLPFAVSKAVSDPDINNANPFPKPGSRLVVSITIKHTAVEGNAELTVNVTIPQFANLPFFADEVTLPPPEAQPWSTFVLHNHTRGGAPSLVSKRSDMSYWAVPFAQNLSHPHFGSLDGGISGDLHHTPQNGWAFGYHYKTPEEHYSGQIGGFTFKESANAQPNIIGGLPF